MNGILMPIITGIASGFILYLSAAGLNLMISGLGVVNFGQGAFFVMGAGICLAVGSLSNSLAAGILAGAAATFLAGGILELMLRPVVGKKLELTLMITIGVTYILQDVYELIWSGSVKTLPAPQFLRGAVRFSGIVIPKYLLFTIVVSSLIAFGLWIVFEKTRLGIVFRAIIDNRNMTECLGKDVQTTYMLMFMIGIALSGIAGGLNLPISKFDANGSMSIFSSIVPIIVIGGLGNIQGTLPAAILVGALNAVVALAMPTMYNFVPIVLMVICIIFKPQGLFTKRRR